MRVPRFVGRTVTVNDSLESMLGVLTSRPLIEKQCRTRLGSSLRSTSSVIWPCLRVYRRVAQFGLAFEMERLVFGYEHDANSWRIACV